MPSPQGEGGTRGGAVALVRPETEVNLEPPSWAPKGTVFKGDDWVAFTIRLTKLSVLIINSYFQPGDENSDNNHNKFNQILRLKRALDLPTALIGDFNLTKQELENLGWPKLFGGAVIQPDVKFTCNSAGSKRIIDYALITFDLLALVGLYPAQETPWGPHIGLELRFKGEAIDAVGWQVRAPKPLPDLVALKDGLERIELEDGTRAEEFTPWKEAVAEWEPTPLSK